MWLGVKRPQEPEKEKKSKERKENIKTNKNSTNKKKPSISYLGDVTNSFCDKPENLGLKSIVLCFISDL